MDFGIQLNTLGPEIMNEASLSVFILEDDPDKDGILNRRPLLDSTPGVNILRKGRNSSGTLFFKV